MPEPDPNAPLALELFRRWRDGDRDALDQLLTMIQPWLRTEISQSLGNRVRGMQDSLDLAQNAVLNFLKWGPKFVPESESQFRALLKRIATNEAIDAQRHQGRRDRGGHIESMRVTGQSFSGFGPAARTSERPDAVMERESDAEWVRLALQFLEPDERHLLLASEVEGQDWATIAADLGLASADAARVRCTRLKPKVARLLMQLRRGRMPAES
jgi:RNA polymerase sigma factor (sigma-70 family)